MNWKKLWAINQANRQRWLKLDPTIPDSSGIYILTRIDENGVKFSYIGQAKHILDRLANHLSNYQHIDLSLKSHGLYNAEKNPYGWQVEYITCEEEKLDFWEQHFIKKYLDAGYQSRNKTLGGQGKGKVGLGDGKSTKGYREGVEYGYQKAIKEIKTYFDKYLYFAIQKPTNKIKERKLEELKELLNEKNNHC